MLILKMVLFQWKHGKHYKISQLRAISELHRVVWCDQEFLTLLISAVNSETIDAA